VVVEVAVLGNDHDLLGRARPGPCGFRRTLIRQGSVAPRHEAPRGADQRRRRPRIGPYRTRIECETALITALGRLSQGAHVQDRRTTFADDQAAFATSANLTEAAFDRNIEAGVLTRGHALVASLARHFGTLIERSLLVPLASP
jgi:phosphatidylserine/phosphatidylglycerophosphate/cardiolipin synthase-like enzyme